MEKPLVSVILPTYNRGEYIRKAIESVFNQSYKNIELIIVNDGSTDNTSQILSEAKERDPRVVILTNETNLGLVKSLNKGVENARAEYIARIDDDDVWSDFDKLEKQVRFLESSPDYVLVGGGVIVIDKEDKEVARYLLPKKDEEIRNYILLNNSFAHPTVMFRKQAWQKAGGYDERLNFSEDWDLWLRFGRLGKFHNFQEYFVYYLKGGQNRCNYYNIGRHLRANIRLRKKYRDSYPGYWKAYLLCWASAFYYLLPFRQKFRPILFKLRVLIFGQPAYRYIKEKKL